MPKFTVPAAPLACAIALTLGLGLAACKKDDAPAAAATPAVPAGPTAEEKAAAAAAAQAEAALAALTPEELKKRGSQALREQRLYAPAGDNAMEYYLALRKQSEKPDASAESALMDLQPYAVIAAEQALGREDWIEADRLRKLIEAADPNAPALPRIASAIETGKAAADRRVAEAATQAEAQAKAAEEAKKRAEELARQQAEAARTAAATPAAPTPAAPTRPQPTPAAPTPAVAQPQPTPAAPAPAPARAASSALVPVSTPQPEYPQDALRRGTTGAVTLEFTVNPDGSVGNLVVVNATPRGVFERGVQNTVRRWRFQPIASPQVVRRTFNFAN